MKTEAAYLQLARVWAVHMEAQRPVDRARTRAAFDAQVDLLHALGFRTRLGSTPTALHMAVMDSWANVGPRPAHAAYNGARAAWDAAMIAEIEFRVIAP